MPINQNTIVGIAEFITDEPITILESENYDDFSNSNAVLRRLQLGHTKDPIVTRVAKSNKTIYIETNTNTNSKHYSNNIPDNLQSLYRNLVKIKIIMKNSSWKSY